MSNTHWTTVAGKKGKKKKNQQQEQLVPGSSKGLSKSSQKRLRSRKRKQAEAEKKAEDDREEEAVRKANAILEKEAVRKANVAKIAALKAEAAVQKAEAEWEAMTDKQKEVQTLRMELERITAKYARNWTKMGDFTKAEAPFTMGILKDKLALALNELTYWQKKFAYTADFIPTLRELLDSIQTHGRPGNHHVFPIEIPSQLTQGKWCDCIKDQRFRNSDGEISAYVCKATALAECDFDPKTHYPKFIGKLALCTDVDKNDDSEMWESGCYLMWESCGYLYMGDTRSCMGSPTSNIAREFRETVDTFERAFKLERSTRLGEIFSPPGITEIILDYIEG